MPRAPRVHIEEGLYFITTKGDHGTPLFKDDNDRMQYMELLEKYKTQFAFKLFSYVLMVDLVHLLLQISKGATTSEVMHAINSSYTKYFNGRYEKRGHLFQERFISILAEKETYLTKLSRFIHLKPLQLKLVNNPKDYKWSSCQYYLTKEGNDPLGIVSDAREVLSFFSSNQDEAMKLYKEFMKSASSAEQEQLRKKLERSRLLGSKIFVEEIKKQIKEETEQKEKELMEQPAHKLFMTSGIIVVIVLAIFAIYVYMANLGLGKTLDKRNREFSEKLLTEKENLRKDLIQRHRADMVSYKAATKRLELEKNRAKKLEDKLKEK